MESCRKDHHCKCAACVDIWKERYKKLKVFDLVENQWAGNGNPQKILLLISKGKMIKCLSISGKIVEFYNDSSLRLRKLTSINITTWEILQPQSLKDQS